MIRTENGAVRRHKTRLGAVPRDCCCDLIQPQICGGLNVWKECGVARDSDGNVVDPGPDERLFYEENMCLRSLVWVGAMYTGEYPNYSWDNFPKMGAWVEPSYVFRHAARRRHDCSNERGSSQPRCRRCCYIPGRPARWGCIDFNMVGGGGGKNLLRRITEYDADYDLGCGGDENFFITNDYFEQIVEIQMGDTYSGVPFTLFFSFTSSKWKRAHFDGDGNRTGNTYLNNKDIGGFLGYMIDSNWDEPGYQYVGVDSGSEEVICPPPPVSGDVSCPED